jgi:uncharacterized membrane protein YkgB
MRIAIAIVFLWIGALKFVPYEADSITPFVANNPVMRLFYKHPGEYKAHLTREGELVPAEREWQMNNNTYGISRGLGIVEVLIGLLTLIGLFSPRYGLAGAMLSLLTPLVTLSFLITTPEAWVGNLGDANFGFPFLSGRGAWLSRMSCSSLVRGWSWSIACGLRCAIERLGSRRLSRSATYDLLPHSRSWSRGDSRAARSAEKIVDRKLDCECPEFACFQSF